MRSAKALPPSTRSRKPKQKASKKSKARKVAVVPAPKLQAKRSRRIRAAETGADRIERLAVGLAEIAGGFRAGSARTTRLLSAGPGKMAQKVIEEAAELGIEAVRGDLPALIRESADLIYNVVALWTALGVGPADVWHEMDQRELALGLAEKLPKTTERE